MLSYHLPTENSSTEITIGEKCHPCELMQNYYCVLNKNVESHFNIHIHLSQHGEYQYAKNALHNVKGLVPMDKCSYIF
jgi:hypothetical protein